MRKLGKLSISPEKIMKNEELINLKGGYSDYKCILFDDETGLCSWATPDQSAYNWPECDPSKCVSLD